MSEQVNTDIDDTYTDPESSINSIMSAQAKISSQSVSSQGMGVNQIISNIKRFGQAPNFFIINKNYFKYKTTPNNRNAAIY